MYHASPFRTDVPEPLARACAKWWRDQLEGVPHLDNGDKSRAGGMAMVMGMLAVKPKPKVLLDKFEEVLARTIQAQGTRVDLDVDYHPGHTLNNAIQDALTATLSDPAVLEPRKPEETDEAFKLREIRLRQDFGDLCSGFPWKTHMHVYHAYAEVARGYGAKSAVFAGVKPLEIEDKFWEYRAVTTRSTDGEVWETSFSLRWYDHAKPFGTPGRRDRLAQALVQTKSSGEAAKVHPIVLAKVLAAAALVGAQAPTSPTDADYGLLGEEEWTRRHDAYRTAMDAYTQALIEAYGTLPKLDLGGALGTILEDGASDAT